MRKLSLLLTALFFIGTTGFSQLEHEWTFSFGGSTGALGDQLVSMDTDSSGNYYLLCKNYSTTDYDPSPAVANYSAGNYLVKYDASRSLVWVKMIATTASFDFGELIVDDQQNLLITGNFDNTVDFDPGAGTYNLTASAAALREAFLLKLTGDGDFIWAFKLDGDYTNRGYGLVTNPTGDIYWCGTFTSNIDMDPGAGIVSYSTNLYNDGFIAKFDSSGNYQWSIQLGGTLFQSVYDVTLDNQLNPVVVGTHYLNTDFDGGAATFNLPYFGAYAAKYSPSGNLLWVNGVQPVGGSISAGRTAVDNLGNVYLTGTFSDSLNVDPGNTNLTYETIGTDDAFLVQFNTNGNYQWNNITGNPGLYYATPAVWVDYDNDVLWANAFDTLSVKSLTSSGQLNWEENFEVNNFAVVNVIERIDNKIHLAGQYRDTLFISPTDTLISLGNTDMFWSVFGESNQPPALTLVSPLNVCAGDTLYTTVVYSDEDTIGTNYAAVSGNTGIVPQANLAFMGAGPNQTLQIIPTASIGNTFIYITATDTGGLATTDSILVNVYPTYNANSSFTICQGDSLFLGGAYQTTSGVYTDSLQSISGCDSIINTTLTVNAVDTGVSNSGSSITANATGASFQWFDCNTMTAITGETNATFTPSATGDYAVQITQNGCIDTSACVNIVVTGIDASFQLSTLNLHRNPTPGKLRITFKGEMVSTITLRNNLGQLLLTNQLRAVNQFELDLSAYPAGIYFLQLEVDDQVITKKIVRE